MTDTMLAAAVVGPGKVELQRQPMPRWGGEFARVRVTAVPMCTEFKQYQQGAQWGPLGHEAVGVVEAVEAGRKVRVGQRVVAMPMQGCGACSLCRSGDYIYCENAPDVPACCGGQTGAATYAQHLIKQDWLLLPIPDDICDEHAGLACCGLGPTFGAMQRLNVGAFDCVLIAGMGPVGLGGVINATHRGARVIALEPNPYRAQLALTLGAAHAIDPTQDGALKRIFELTEGQGASAGIDCTGMPAAHRLLIDGAARRGRVAFVGEGGETKLYVSNDLLRKGLALHGCWHWNLADAPKVWQVIRDNRAKLDQQITHRFGMSQLAEAFDLQTTGRCGKVMLDPWG